MKLSRKQKEKQRSLIHKIKEYWRTHYKRDTFKQPMVALNESSGEIVSDMINGWPEVRTQRRSR